MRLPRDLSGRGVAKALVRLEIRDYPSDQQSHSLDDPAQWRATLTIPDHHPLRVWTLAGILADVARHHHLTRDRLIRLLFSRS